ncbi:MAG TPA: hypothetical protein VKP58_10375 [Candidatus Acidoferrum sp.]|nr:hypothetical protein [Candidatus Acidoferrum sp.]
MLPQRESLPAVTAAGVVAIIFASLGVLACGLITVVLLMMPNFPNQSGVAPMPAGTRTMVIGVYALLFAICVGELIIAINVLRRRNWARIALLVWAGLMAFFSAATCIVFFFAMNFVPHAAQNPQGPNVLAAIKFIMLVFYGIPFGVAVWWLILFNRPRVAAAFRAPSAMAPVAPVQWAVDASGFPVPVDSELTPIPPKKPSCPVPLLIVAGFLLFSAVVTPLVLLLPQKVATPMFLFGFTVFGPGGKIAFAAFSLIGGVLAIGLFRLKPRALDVVIALHAILLVNALFSLASPTFLHSMYSAMQQNAAQNPDLPGGAPFLSYNFARGALIGGIALSSAILGVLVGFRDRFLKAAAEAAR